MPNVIRIPSYPIDNRRHLSKSLGFLLAFWWTLLAGLSAPAVSLAGFEPAAGVAVETTQRSFDRYNRVYFIYANLLNDSAEPLTGPVRLVVEGSSLAVLNRHGLTDAGEPYFRISDVANYRLGPGARSERSRIDFELARRRLTHSFRVETESVNSAPTAHAGPDQTAYVGDTVTLDGSGSSDVDGQPLSFLWELTPPDGSVAGLDDPAAVMPHFTVDLPGDYHGTVTANDGFVDGVPDVVVVTTENSPPVADAGPDQTAFVGDIVTLDGSWKRGRSNVLRMRSWSSSRNSYTASACSGDQ